MKAKNCLAFLCLALALAACRDESKMPPATPASATGGNPAIEGLTKKIEASPNDASLYAARGAVLYENEGYDEGIADLTAAIRLDSAKAEYYHTLADMYLDYSKSRMALSVMERAGVNFPERIPTLLKLAEFQLILKQHNQALFTLERIKLLDPQSAEMFFMFGNVFKDMGKADQAITAYQSAVENDADLVDAWISLGNLLAAKKSPAAAKYFDNALRADSNSIEALHAKAYYLSNTKNDLPGAAKLYRKINALNPQYEKGHYNLGLLYMDMDSVQQARRSFDLAIKTAPAYAEAYYHRGLAAEMMGDLAKAKADYEEVLRLQPEFWEAEEGVKRLAKQ